MGGRNVIVFCRGLGGVMWIGVLELLIWLMILLNDCEILGVWEVKLCGSRIDRGSCSKVFVCGMMLRFCCWFVYNNCEVWVGICLF